MIRRRFNSGRLSRIAAWALATVTAMAAIVNNQMAAADDQNVGTPDPASNDRSAGIKATIPAAPVGGLLILRYQPASTPPPTIVHRVVVEERVAGTSASAPTATPSQAASPSAPAASAAVPPSPPPPPAPLPVQSSGS